ncbi:hypothetical protein DY000_02027264 [Brassica cretica]|uniref:5'-3' exoribonuclease 1 SH3-like domain-containing protein n=1 Tax=Brassica cretica TaxID=69181 RepID=A0ABQ7EMI9_BRACR|nr:hypothetical protein DY000_02027264 [Brassica cretica]
MSMSETSDNSSDSSGTEDQSPRSSEDRSPRPKRVKVSDGGDIVVAGNAFEQEPLAGLVIFKQDVLDGLVECKDLGVSFEEFPYYLSDTTKTALVSASVHLKCKEFANREVLGALSAAEIQSRKLQTLELIDSQKSSDKPAGEGDASSPSNVSDSQLTLMKAPLTPTFRAGMSSKMFATIDFFKVFLDFCLMKKYLQVTGGPSHGSKGTVVLGCGDNPSSKVGVRFDEPISDGVDLNRQCEEGRGFFFSAVDLLSDSSGSEDLDELLINTLFEVVRDVSRSCPLVLFLKDAEKFDTGRQAPVSTKRLPLPLLLESTVSINSQQNIGRQVPEAAKRLTKLFENDVSIECPQDENLLTVWNNQLDRDSEILQMRANTKQLHMMLRRSGFVCDGFDKLCLKDLKIDTDDAEKIIGWALSHHATRKCHAAPDAQISLSLDPCSMDFGIRLLKARLIESAFSKKYREEIAAGKEFMERLLSDLITPKNISEKFDDIGAIKDVKEAFVEHVVVPFKLPGVTETIFV